MKHLAHGILPKGISNEPLWLWPRIRSSPLEKGYPCNHLLMIPLYNLPTQEVTPWERRLLLEAMPCDSVVQWAQIRSSPLEKSVITCGSSALRIISTERKIRSNPLEKRVTSGSSAVPFLSTQRKIRSKPLGKRVTSGSNAV